MLRLYAINLPPLPTIPETASHKTAMLLSTFANGSRTRLVSTTTHLSRRSPKRTKHITITKPQKHTTTPRTKTRAIAGRITTRKQGPRRGHLIGVRAAAEVRDPARRLKPSITLERRFPALHHRVRRRDRESRLLSATRSRRNIARDLHRTRVTLKAKSRPILPASPLIDLARPKSMLQHKRDLPTHFRRSADTTHRVARGGRRRSRRERT